jgi:Holliday junction DNA helicase RuvA
LSFEYGPNEEGYGKSMIALLNGNIVEVNGGEAVLDVNGVGYSVRVPATYMPKQRNGVKLYIDTVVREDSITLYGFESASEKEMFKRFYSVSGVGPKTALAIVSFYSPDDLRKIIASKDIGLLSKVPGIGRKTAERVIMELKDKLGLSSSATSSDGTVEYVGESRSVYDQLMHALMNFGYKRNEAAEALKPRLDDINNGRPVEEILRTTLRSMM